VIIDFSAAAVSTDPFPFFVEAQALREDIADAALRWCENFAPWSLTVADFYEQYELDLGDVPLPPELEPLRDERVVEGLRDRVGRLLGLTLAGSVEITLHRLVDGQRIRTHDDQLPDGAVARAIIQLNRGWTMDQGGVLLLFESPTDDAPRRVIAPVHRSAAGFAISGDSHHAVSVVRGADRFTIVYSFHA
jgi:Rps23 Pro-64 3,4-dihydroxylase Tpa1-like proline 4-hydroxylase